MSQMSSVIVLTESFEEQCAQGQEGNLAKVTGMEGGWSYILVCLGHFRFMLFSNLLNLVFVSEFNFLIKC